MPPPTGIPVSPAPAPVSQPKKGRRIFFLVSVIVLVTVIAGFAYYVIQWNRGTVNGSNQSLQTQLEILNTDPQAAIRNLQTIINTTQVSAAQGSAKLALSSAYLAAGDIKSAIETCKSISTDDSYLPQTRALAVDCVISDSSRPSISTEEVFSGPVWGSFIEGAAPDYAGQQQALVNAMKYGESIYPWPVTEYRLAEWYARALYRTTDPALHEQYLNEAQRYITLGDQNYAAAIAAGGGKFTNNEDTVPGLSDYSKATCLYLKATALTELYGKKPTAVEIDTIAAAFNQSITLFDTAATSRTGSQIWALRARVFLAGFLNSVDSSKYKESVLSTLSPIINPAQVNLNALLQLKIFLQSYAINPVARVGPLGSNIADLANISPKFKDLLLQSGWQESYLPQLR